MDINHSEMCSCLNVRSVCFGIALLVTGWTSVVRAQPPSRPSTEGIPQQSVYLEFGGNGIIYSLNYDALFQSDWGIRLGGSYYPPFVSEDNSGYSSDEGSTAFLGLIMGLRTFGETAHKFELGSGLLFGTIYDPTKWEFIEPPGATFSVGYRYYPKEDSRVTFKAAFTPVVNRSGFHPRVGLSLGITLTPEGDASVF